MSGFSLQLNGNGYIRRNSLDNDKTNYTMRCFVKILNNNNNNNTWTRIFVNGSRGFCICNNKLAFYDDNYNKNSQLISSTTVEFNKWYELIGINENNIIRFFINGVEITTYGVISGGYNI